MLILYIYIYIYIYTYIYKQFSGYQETITFLNKLEIIKKNWGGAGGGFRISVLTTVLWVVTPCISVEVLQVSKQYYTIIFGFIISLYGDIGVYSLHNICCSICCYYSQSYCYCWLLYLSGNCCQRTMSAQNLSKDVLEQLECPVCMQYILLPITICCNWHTICSNCKQKIQNVQPAENHFQIQK